MWTAEEMSSQTRPRGEGEMGVETSAEMDKASSAEERGAGTCRHEPQGRLWAIALV